jgi:hypothetical protein
MPESCSSVFTFLGQWRGTEEVLDWTMFLMDTKDGDCGIPLPSAGVCTNRVHGRPPAKRLTMLQRYVPTM